MINKQQLISTSCENFTDNKFSEMYDIDIDLGIIFVYMFYLLCNLEIKYTNGSILIGTILRCVFMSLYNLYCWLSQYNKIKYI